ncbi:MAG: hypothetical protein H0W67_07455 [Gemmatimonadales bacterium]|nr:hypothetical protein [Gemmatimonadales bacterium]
MTADRREGRLRQEFAAVYPFLTPGVWEPASVLTEKVVAWRLQQPLAGRLVWNRVLNPDHFEFRGEQVADEAARKRRRTDR